MTSMGNPVIAVRHCQTVYTGSFAKNERVYNVEKRANPLSQAFAPKDGTQPWGVWGDWNDVTTHEVFE